MVESTTKGEQRMTEQEYMELIKEFSGHFKRMTEIADKIETEGDWAFPTRVCFMGYKGVPDVTLLADNDKALNWRVPEFAYDYVDDSKDSLTTGKRFIFDGVRYQAQLTYQKKEVSQSDK